MDLSDFDFNNIVDVETLGCCGVGEIYGIQSLISERNKLELIPLTPELIVLKIKKEVPYCYPHMIFTVAKIDRHKIGDELARYVRKYHLGTVHASHWKYNPNSHNLVKAFMWEVDWKNMNSFTGTPPRRRPPARARSV